MAVQKWVGQLSSNAAVQGSTEGPLGGHIAYRPSPPAFQTGAPGAKPTLQPNTSRPRQPQLRMAL